MTVSCEGELAIHSESDIILARKSVRETASAMGFGITDVTRIVTAASELVRNIYLYAGSGTMRWRTISNQVAGLELVFEDHGPGIPDLDKAMEPGYTTSRGLGMGLPGSKRLMDEMELVSEPGKGTTVRVRKWLRQYSG